MTILTDHEAERILQLTLDILARKGASDVLEGIDESRRLGIEEALPEQKETELRQVGRTRRRPPNDAEMLQIVVERLYQRLVVVPRIARAIRTEMKSEDVVWRVDTEFSSVDRYPDARLQNLLPEGTDEVAQGFIEIVRTFPAISEREV